MSVPQYGQILHIDSADRSSGTSDDFQLQLPRSYNCSSAELISVQLPNTLYTVDASNCNIYWTSSIDGALSGSILNGFYNITNFPAAVQAAMNFSSVTVTYIVTYNSVTGKLAIVPSSGTISMTFLNKTNAANILMGFNASNQTAGAANNGDNLVDLSGIKYALISISGIDSNSVLGSNANTFGSYIIPIGTNTGGIVNFEVNDEFKIVSSTVTLQSLSVKLRRQNGSSLFLNGVNWSMVLRLRKC